MHWTEAIAGSNVGLATAKVKSRDGVIKVYERGIRHCEVAIYQAGSICGYRIARPEEYSGLGNWEPVIMGGG